MYKGIIKRLALATLLSCFSTHAFAVAAGFYYGLETGPATNDAGPQNVTVPIVPAPPPGILPIDTQARANARSNQWGTRLFIGNKINDYFGMELGLSLFSNIIYKPVTASSSPTSSVRVKTFDVGLYGSFPFKNIEIFIKPSAAYVYLTTSGGMNSSGKSTYRTSVRPMFQIGGSYTFNQKWVGQVTLERILVGSFVNSVTFFAVGFSYHFVDIFCGQFLCDD